MDASATEKDKMSRNDHWSAMNWPEWTARRRRDFSLENENEDRKWKSTEGKSLSK